MSAMSFPISGVPLVSSSRRDTCSKVCHIVASSQHELHTPGVRRVRLTSSSKQARGRFSIAASVATDTRGTSKADSLCELRREAFPPEILYLEELVVSLTRSASFDEKVGFRTPLAFNILESGLIFR